MIQLDFTIRYFGKRWIVENDLLKTAAPTLDELDINIKNLLIDKKIIIKGEKAKLFMAFDNSTIPQWIRQYSQHYFNRIVEVEG
jgi:Family of unknown function (DUF5395)